MYKGRSTLALGLALAFIGSCAHAERLPPGSPLSGYQCYHIDAAALKLTAEDAWEGKGFPSMFDGPSADSGKLGVASGLVYVAWPLQKENGFVRVLSFGGDVGWISEAVIRPLYRDPGSKGGCILSWHGNLVQFHLDPGAKAWLFRDGHDIPVDKYLERSSHSQ
jgi:hypothetical protein